MKRTNSTLRVKNITFGVDNMSEMLDFYETVLHTHLTPVQMLGTTCYAGRLVDLPILFCPKNVAGEASTPQHLVFAVENLEETIFLAERSGGQPNGEILENNHGRFAFFMDPDGNRIEFIQKHAD